MTVQEMNALMKKKVLYVDIICTKIIDMSNK